jgi:hypothetical protein
MLPGGAQREARKGHGRRGPAVVPPPRHTRDPQSPVVGVPDALLRRRARPPLPSCPKRKRTHLPHFPFSHAPWRGTEGARRGHGKGTEGTDGGPIYRSTSARSFSPRHIQGPYPPLSESQTPCWQRQASRRPWPKRKFARLGQDWLICRGNDPRSTDGRPRIATDGRPQPASSSADPGASICFETLIPPPGLGCLGAMVLGNHTDDRGQKRGSPLYCQEWLICRGNNPWIHPGRPPVGPR